MGVRRQAREAALQAIFMCDALGAWEPNAVQLCFDHFGCPEAALPYADVIGRGVVQNLAEIDSKISCASEHWSLSRMSRVDRCLLRLATYEITFLDDIPLGVAIDEAIEIAKRFGSENSPTFVNGVLDRIATTLRKKIEIERVAAKPLAVEVEIDGGGGEIGDGEEKPAKPDSWRLM